MPSQVAGVRIAALATPGHRPDHMAYVVEDESRSGAPWLVITGDSLFVGDLARPDLAIEPKEGARDLYHSVRRLLELEDFAEVWPGHIGGSLCGGAGMSEKPGSTIGFERRFNRLAGIQDEGDFVDELTGKLAAQPPNFKRIVALNQGPLLTEAQPLEGLAPPRVAGAPGSGRDTPRRACDPRVRCRAHSRGDQRDHGQSRRRDSCRLGRRPRERRRGLGGERASTPGGSADSWRLSASARSAATSPAASRRGSEAGLPVETTPAIDISGLAERLRRGDVRLLDVREDDEWEEGHVDGSMHIPYHELRDGVPGELANGDGRQIAVVCSAGNRSSIAASLLRRSGVDNILHVAEGGVADLADEGVRAHPRRVNPANAACYTRARAAA